MSRKKKLIASVFLISVFCMLFSTTVLAGGLVDTMKKHLSGMLEDLCPALFDELFGSLPVACINILSILHSKCF